MPPRSGATLLMSHVRPVVMGAVDDRATILRETAPPTDMALEEAGVDGGFARKPAALSDPDEEDEPASKFWRAMDFMAEASIMKRADTEGFKFATTKWE